MTALSPLLHAVHATRSSRVSPSPQAWAAAADASQRSSGHWGAAPASPPKQATAKPLQPSPPLPPLPAADEHGATAGLTVDEVGESGATVAAEPEPPHRPAPKLWEDQAPPQERWQRFSEGSSPRVKLPQHRLPPGPGR